MTEIDKYFNKNILDIVDNEFINMINTTKDITIISNKIDNIELDYIQNIKEIKESYEKNNITLLFSNVNSLEILQKELEIIRLISKYSLQNNKLEYSFIMSCLKYLYELSEILRIRLKQPPIVISKQNKTCIIRCSYKFCNFKDSCAFNYNKNSHCCYQDHYVHNMISHDISALLMYIEASNTEQYIIHNKDILKSINTLAFCISHMETELRIKCIYVDKKEWENFHYVHNVKN